MSHYQLNTFLWKLDKTKTIGIKKGNTVDQFNFKSVLIILFYFQMLKTSVISGVLKF